LLYDKFILQLETPEDDDDDEEDEEEDEGDDNDQTHDKQTPDPDTTMDDTPSSPSSSSGSTSHESSSSTTTATAPSSTTTTGSPHKLSPSQPSTIDTEMPAADDDDDLTPPSNATILHNKRTSPLFHRLFRSKGEFLLATRPHRAGEWSQAGGMLTLRGGRPWFCTLPPEHYTTGDAEVDALVQHDIRQGGEWGDRRQEIVFIGEKLDVTALERVLDGCLLTDAEMEQWEGIMRGGEDMDMQAKRDRLMEVFEDWFPDWLEEEEDGGYEGHDHGHGHGEHSHVHRIEH
jgi:G3E family GTPase